MDQSGKGVTLQLFRSGTNVCPVNSMIKFLTGRPKLNGPLLCHLNGRPLTRYQFSAVLKKALACWNVNYANYKAHSFRIGAATTAAKLGHSTDTIKLAGSSNAYRAYIMSDPEPSAMPRLAI